MNTHLLMYTTAQEHAYRSAQTWHHPRSRGQRGRVWRKLQTRIQHSGVTTAAGI